MQRNTKPTPLALVHLNKGPFFNSLRVNYSVPWRGATEGHKNWPFNKEQAEENKRLYPNLFREDHNG